VIVPSTLRLLASGTTLQYNTIQYKFIYMAAISWIKRKQSHTNKETHSKLHYWKLVKENGIKEF